MPDALPFLLKVRKAYKFGFALRSAAKERLGAGDPRGRPESITKDIALHQFIELEARAQVATRGKLTHLLSHKRLRLEDVQGQMKRLDSKDRERLRKRHQIGKFEFEALCRVRIHYGQPGSEPQRNTDGRLHPEFLGYQNALNDRIAELRADRSRLFFLTNM